MPRTRSLAVLGMLVLISAQGVRDKRTAAGPAAYMIEINGVGTAMVSAVAGGYVTGDVVTAAAGPGAPPQKNIGSVHVVPVTIEVAPGDLTAWIQESLKGTAQPVSGRILEMDVNYTIASERQFHDALLTEIAFPALDASSKEPARVKLTFQPRQITSKKGDGSKATVAGGPKDTKRATGSAFRVTIPGVDCSGVSRVEPVTVRYKPAENAAGEARAPKSQAGAATAGDLVLSVAESKAAGFAQWATEFLIEGNNGDDREKTVTVELLSPDMKSTILALEGHGVGIYALKPPGGGADPRRVEAQMYVERWQLK
jgi:hypothetical protein